MQSIPIYDTIQGLTILRDDESISSFFYLPRTMRIADVAGKKAFTFLKYQLPVERETKDDKGGGYLVFTTELVEDQKWLDTEVLPKIATRMRAENPNNPNLPPPSLKAIDFISGEVRLLLMKDGRFVTEIQAGRPSLFGNNTASFAVELKDLGAQLFYDALKKGAGIAAIEYDLLFDTRLPAVHVSAHGDSTVVRTAVMGYTTSQVDDSDTWGNDTSTTVAHRTSVSESMESMGLVTVNIDKGSSGIKDEDVEALRAFAFSKLDDWVKDHFLKGGTIATDEDRKSDWMSFIHEDTHEVFNLDLVQRDVVQRQYNPSAQLTPAFLGDDIDNLVLDIDLGTAEWYFNTLTVNVDTNLDFDKYDDIVHSVIGHFSYEGVKDGQNITKRDSFAFTKSDRAPKVFTTRIAAVGKDEYSVEVEINYKVGPVTSAKLYSDTSNVRDYTLRVPNPGVMHLLISATDLQAFDTQKMTSVEVEIKYGDEGKGVPEVIEKVILTKAAASVDYKRAIYASWDQPYHYRTTFVINDDNGPQRLTGEWITEEHDPNTQTAYLSIGTPFDNLFHLAMLPSVDWSEVQTVIVDLDYADPKNDYRQSRTIAIDEANSTTLSQPVWKFPLRDKNNRGYRYAVKVLNKDGTVKSVDFKPAETDSNTLIVGDAQAGVVKVEVDPSDTGVGDKLRRVVVRLRYLDEPNNVRDETALVFRDATPQTWSIARSNAAVNTYTYDVDYVWADGTPPSSAHGLQGTISGTQEFLFLAAPVAPAVVPAVSPVVPAAVPVVPAAVPVTPPTQ